jgi:hypothetical protein
MPTRSFIVLLSISIWLAGCGREQTVNLQEIKGQPKTFVGSETCKSCHLEHYDSWKMTLHSRMLIPLKENPQAIMGDMNPELVRADLAKIRDKLKIPLEEIYIPTPDEILYVIGTQWKQRFVLQREGVYLVAPVQFNVATRRWVNYYEDA